MQISNIHIYCKRELGAFLGQKFLSSIHFSPYSSFSFQTRIPFMGDKESRVSPVGGDIDRFIAYICVQPMTDPA